MLRNEGLRFLPLGGAESQLTPDLRRPAQHDPAPERTAMCKKGVPRMEERPFAIFLGMRGQSFFSGASASSAA